MSKLEAVVVEVEPTRVNPTILSLLSLPRHVKLHFSVNIRVYEQQHRCYSHRTASTMSHSHSHDGPSHSHAAADHGHTHEILDGPGSFMGREMPIIEGRDWDDRSFTVGIGG